jgi:hypothetical protein
MRYLKRYEKLLTKTLFKKVLVSHDFLTKFLREDDWSFIIKSHALVEAAVSEMLTAKIGDDRLHGIFRRLELSNGETGKLAFAKELDLLSSEQRSFVRRLSELRNLLVHNVEKIAFSLDNYVATMDSQQKKAWQSTVIWFSQKEVSKSQWHSIALERPKLALWFSVFMLVGLVNVDSIRFKELTRMVNLSDKNGFVDMNELLGMRLNRKKNSAT